MTHTDPIEQHTDDLAAFIGASPSSYHAAAQAAARLDDAGFTRLDEREDWTPAPERGYVVRDGAVVAWAAPADATGDTPYRIVGAHTDSPGFKLKPGGPFEQSGWRQVGVEVYGGPLLASWFDRELELAGRLVTRDGTEHLARSGPYLRIPRLAIHLDRTANETQNLDRQRHTQPVFGVAADGTDPLTVAATAAGLDPADIAGHDLVLADAQPPVRFGAGNELFASGRLDNLTSVHAGLTALLAAQGTAGHISVLAAFDHEELGSQSRSGASGPLLEDVLGRLTAARGGNESDRFRAFAASWCVSADAGHAVHPNYPEKHDPVNRPVAGGGPLLKLNANQRYTTDAVGAAFWARLCEAARVGYQPFVSNNQVPCGSTIGPLTATRLGIRTLDVGVPLLSMHSARELCHIADPAALAAACTAFFAGA